MTEEIDVKKREPGASPPFLDSSDMNVRLCIIVPQVPEALFCLTPLSFSTSPLDWIICTDLFSTQFSVCVGLIYETTTTSKEGGKRDLCGFLHSIYVVNF